MRIFTYKNLLGTELEFNNLLTKYNLSFTNNIIHRDYRLISDFEEVRTNMQKKNEFLEFYNKRGEVEFALFDLAIIHYILPQIINENCLALKEKIKKILKISLPIDESIDNNEGRNTLFELLFFSYLKSVGMNVRLGDSNPDIFVKIQGRNYFIQCKRLFNFSRRTVRRRMKDAIKQLTLDLKNEGNNSFGIVALSIERQLTQGNKKLVVPTESFAKQELINNLESFVKEYSAIWQNKSLIKDKRFVAIFLHHLTITNIQQQSLFAIGQFILANNTIFPTTQHFSQFSKDFEPLYDIEKCF